MMQMQWLDRRDWTEVNWHRRLGTAELVRQCEDLGRRAERLGKRGEWDKYNELRDVQFILRSELSRRMKEDEDQ